ncbi:MAG: transposase family protein, partial [Gammaproteobacteria bacterium]|nr:transposase family protein [Gammaproteobacteria bacterium]
SVYWDGMYTDVDKYIRSCDKCLRNKPGAVPNSHPMTLIPVSEHSFERVGTDLCEPFPQSEDGYKFVIAFVDYLSRWAITIAVPEASSETIAQHFIEKVVCIFGPPSVLLSDRGANFISQVVTEVCRMLKTQKTATTSYHPQTNGKCERFWGALKTMLKMYVDEDQSTWDRMLPFVMYAYNTGLRSGTGFSPYEVLFGKKPRLPIDNMLLPPKRELKTLPEYVQEVAKRIETVKKVAAKISETQQVKSKERHDRKSRLKRFQVGDLVLIRVECFAAGTSKKLSAFWDGPHRVVYAPVDAPTVIVRMFDDPEGKYDRVSVQRVKKYVCDNDPVVRLRVTTMSLEVPLGDRFPYFYVKIGQPEMYGVM